VCYIHLLMNIFVFHTMFSKHLLQFLLCCQSMTLFSLVLCEKTWKNIVPEDYNQDIAPALHGQPVNVNVSMFVLSLKPDAGAAQVNHLILIIIIQ